MLELNSPELNWVIATFQKTYDVSLAKAPIEPEQAFLTGDKWTDYGLAVVFAFVFPAARFLLTRVVYERAGIYFIYTSHGESPYKTDQDELRTKLQKWNESCWKMTVYALFSALALLVSYQEPWFWDTRLMWLGCSHFPPCNLYVSRGVLLFYCVQTGFYLQAVHYLIFHEVRRKDWMESMIHHIVTAGLMAYSYYVNFARVGIMIMLLHDVSDIFLESAKLARYSRRQGWANWLFVKFLVSWVVMRLVYFPLVIIRSTLTESITLIAEPYGVEHMPHYAIFNGLLLVLLVLHIYWSYLILLVVINSFKNAGNGGDIREKDD